MKHRLVVSKLKIVTHYIWLFFFLTSGPLKEKNHVKHKSQQPLLPFGTLQSKCGLGTGGVTGGLLEMLNLSVTTQAPPLQTSKSESDSNLKELLRHKH